MYRNICILALCVISASALSLRAPREVGPVTTKCARENGLDPQTVLQTNGVNMENRNERCFIACLLKSLGVLKPDGSLNAAVAISSIPLDYPKRDKFIEAFTACSNEKDADDCESTYKIVRCFFSNFNKKASVLPRWYFG